MPRPTDSEKLVPFRLANMNGIEGSRPWLLEYLVNHFTRLKLASNMNGIYAQVLDLNESKRELTLYDGDFTVQAVLTPSTIENMVRENGVKFGQLQGKRIAIVKLVVLPLLNEFPPSLKLILTSVRVFVDSMANRPIQDPPTLINNPRITQVLRSAQAEILAKKAPHIPTNSPTVSKKEDSGNSPPRSVRLEPVQIPPPQEPVPEVSDRFRRLSLPPAIVPGTKGAISAPEKRLSTNSELNNDIEILEGNISPIRNGPPLLPVAKSTISNLQVEELSPQKSVARTSKSPADEDNTTLEVDDEEHRNALPELHENLIQRGYLRGRSPPPLSSSDNDDIVEDGNTTMVERKNIENGETERIVESNDGEQTADVVMTEENGAVEKGKETKVVMPMTQQYDDDDEEEEEETPVPLQEKKAERNETMPLTQHYEDEEEVNEADKSQEGDQIVIQTTEIVTQTAEGDPLSTLSSDGRIPCVPNEPNDENESNAAANGEDEDTEDLNITLPDDPIEGALEEEAVEENDGDKNTPEAGNPPASRKRETKDRGRDDEEVGCVKKARGGNDEKLRVVDVDEEKGEMEGRVSGGTEAPRQMEMKENEKRRGKKKLLIENKALVELVSERVDAAMKVFDRFEVKEDGDFWDVILP